jgi:hypothetical protein
MTRPVSALYRRNLQHLPHQISSHLNKGIEKFASTPQVYFRADDIGIPSKTFTQLAECFIKHKTPLCLAAVPVWTTPERMEILCSQIAQQSSQWFWHQHGFAHHNHETIGKKQEFGDSRAKSDIAQNLQKGKERLEMILGRDFNPVFTPPWNRCNQITLDSLVTVGFKAVSRSRGAHPVSTVLPDFQVNVDLHTRKEIDTEYGMQNLLTELEKGLASGRCGIMLHHQRMNNRALHFLDLLLGEINKAQKVETVHFGDLLNIA